MSSDAVHDGNPVIEICVSRGAFDAELRSKQCIFWKQPARNIEIELEPLDVGAVVVGSTEIVFVRVGDAFAVSGVSSRSNVAEKFTCRVVDEMVSTRGGKVPLTGRIL
jgi:hypothetical protein